jgi:hypothetical protein
MEKVQHRAGRMVWREDMVLHLVNLSSLSVVESNEFVSEWQKGIEKAQSPEPMDRADNCLWGTVFELFDSVEIHSMVTDPASANWGDLVTAIPTNRRTIFVKYSIRESDADDWYLIVPPLVRDPAIYAAYEQGLTPDSKAPLAQWKIEGSSHGPRECESEGKTFRELGIEGTANNTKYMSRFIRKDITGQWSWSLPICENLARSRQLSEATLRL